MKKRLLSILLTACLALTLCTGLSGTLLAKAADESSIHINDIVQVKVGDSLTDLKVYRNGVYEAMVPVESGTYTAMVFINGAATDMTTTFTADAAGEVYLRVKGNDLTQVEIQSCALVGNFTNLSFVNEAGEPFSIGQWNPADPNAELTYLGGGLYGRTFRFQALKEDIPIADTGYKVAFNDEWAYSFGDGSANIDLTIPAGSSSLTVLVDEINQVVYDSVRSGSFSVAQGSSTIEKPALATTVSLIGTARCNEVDNWIVDAKGYEFDLISDTLYRYQKTFEAGTYQYKCVFDYESWYAADRSFNLTEKTHVVFLYDTFTGRLYDTVNDYSTVAELIGMQVPPAQTKVSAKYLDETGEEQTAFCDATITADNPLTTLGELGKTTWYVVQGEVTISSRVTVSGDVHLILADGCELTVNGGIQVQDDDNNPNNGSPNALTIYAQSTDESTMGKLTAKIIEKEDRAAAIGSENGDNGYGSGNITINGGSVTAIGTAGAGIGGDYDTTGSITITGGVVTAIGSEAYRSYGISGGSISINGNADVTAIGGDSEEYSTGIRAENVTITGGSVEAKGGDAKVHSCGILAGSELTITGGSVETKGSNAMMSYGIYVRNGDGGFSDMNISGKTNVTAIGGTATATGDNEDTVSCGIYASRNLTIDGGTVNAEGGKAKASYGITALYQLTIEDSSVNAEGGKAEDSYGITALNVSIKGSTVKTEGGEAENNSHGINVRNVSIKDSTVKTEGGEAGNNSYGIIVLNKVTITGGSVEVKGGTAKRNNSDGIIAFGGVTITAGSHVTVQTSGNGTNGHAMNPGSSLVLPEAYWWRTADTDPFTASVTKPYGYKYSDAYVEFTDSFTITLDPNFDGGESGTMTTDADGKLTEILPDLTRDGYTFDGWFTEATGGEKVTNETEFNGYVTIYAHWTINQYTITFDTDGGSEIAPITQDYGTDVTAPENPTKTGYAFAGWEPEIPGTMPAEDMTITAKWTKNSSGGGVSTYAITVESAKNGAVTVAPKTAAKGDIVTLTVEPDKGYTLETLTVTNASGKEVKLTEKNGKYTFTMPGSKVTVKATFMEDNSMLNFFVDVPADAYYYDAVLWAAENGITGGVDDTHFAPNAPCTRAQIVTFLWRAAGCPEPESVSSFADVPADSYYAKAVAWAVENGITTGSGDGMFSPNATCTRAQAMTFIWRSQKSVAAAGANPFTDVAADAYYAGAVQWAVENGVTNGTSDTTFSPNTNCTRAQIVTFLYRCLGEE